MAISIPSVFGNLLINIIVAIIILLLGFVAGKLLGSGVHKLLATIFAGKKIKGDRKNSSFALGLSSLVSLLIYIIAVILALERIGITAIVLQVIIAAIAIIFVGFILVAVIDFAANFYFGLNIILGNKIAKGDYLKLKRIEGTVKKVSIINTQVVTKSGDLFVLSNKLLSKNRFIRERKLESK